MLIFERAAIGAAGADDDMPPSQVVWQCIGAMQQQRRQLGDLDRLGQPPLAGVAAGQPAAGGFEDESQKRASAPRSASHAGS